MLCISQKPQSQETKSYATEPSVPESPSDDGPHLRDVVNFPVFDRVSIGEGLHGHIGEDIGFFSYLQYVSSLRYLHDLLVCVCILKMRRRKSVYW